jgi:ABC-type Zn uptake system ZnuABC Zn-binding protein ZnuA
MRPFLTLIVLIFALVVAGGVAAQDTPLNVVATTTILADVASHVGGDLLTVTSLLPANTDTHAYQFTPQDVTRVADADLLLTVGAGYEAFLGGLLENAGDVTTVVVSNGVDILAPLGDHDHEEDDHAHEADDHAHDEDAAHADEGEDHDHAHLGHLGEDVVCEAHAHQAGTADEGDDHDHGTCDPHVWTDPANVMIWVYNIADAFAAADPANADAYRANAAQYNEQLAALDSEINDLISTLPEERRVLVTNHEFLNYFAHAYGFEVAATVLPGVSTSAEASPQQLTTLIDLIRDEGVPAVFAEVSANAQLAEIVGQEAGVTVVTDLYTESLSDANGPAATYIDYMRHNANTIVTALASA